MKDSLGNNGLKLHEDMKGNHGRLHIQIFEDDRLVEERHVPNLITEEGERHIANQLTPFADVPMNFMGIGTGSGQTAVDQDLDTEVARVPLTSRVQGSGGEGNTVVYQTTFEKGIGTGTITEAGIFNDDEAGVMLCYSSFDAIAKLANVAIVITWTLTISS